MRPRYPLTPLERVRQLEVDARERDLRTRVLKVQHEAEARAQKEVSLAEEREHSERVRSSARERLAGGGARALDLARSAAFELGARLREQARKQELEAARRDERAAEEAEHQARAELARARARQSALERHRERFDQADTRAAEREADADAIELHQHRVREGRT